MSQENTYSIISEYLSDVERVLNSGDAREHAYRPAFQKLIESLMPNIQVINEPAYTGGNAPDFLFKKSNVPIAYAECKDLTVNLSDKVVQKQADRYVQAFGRVLLTNYYEFQIIREENDEIIDIKIAEFENGKIKPLPDHFQRFKSLIIDYITPQHRTIRSAQRLAEIMSIKARILRDNALASLTENPHSEVNAQYNAFKQVLIHDLSKEDFADMYSQTLVYGLFVARYFDPTLPTFSREEAHMLLPSTNPLLKKFFGHVAGVDYDPKIAWLVDSLIEAFLSTDVYNIMHREFTNKNKDPVLHFYETFLSEYDPNLRKSRGVYYTPEPVVSFIVRSVDEILKNKFNLPEGLADRSMMENKIKVQGSDARQKDGIKRGIEQIHRVQILDPAVGTGTFLNEVIHEIHKNFKDQEGLWAAYAKEHLLPRLHGFELMMASYTMAHLNLGITLAELGYKCNERLSVWLTNSLEEGVSEVPNLFMNQWLTEESRQASEIKSEKPIMVVLGNPPYSGESFNKNYSGHDVYKVEAGGKQKLQEKNSKWLNDDYVKFIRFAESSIEKTDEGAVGLITPHGYLDNPTFRGMRWHLMKTFDEIYVLDLHGNANKKEMTPEGGKDENVFNIKTGTAILLAIKNKAKSKKSQSTLQRKRSWDPEAFDSAFYAHSPNAIPYLKSLIPKARENRKAGNPVENKMWYELLANKQLEGYKFSRQKPLFTYIADFYCSELGLVVELDGDSHIGQEEYDENRTKELEQFGLTVVRYPNSDVMNNLEGVREDLLSRIQTLQDNLPSDPAFDPPTPFEGGAKRGELGGQKRGGDLAKTDLATVYHAELFGKQKEKYEQLERTSWKNLKWTKLSPKEPNLYFIKVNHELRGKYNKGFSMGDLFLEYSTGILTKNDKVTIDFLSESLWEKVNAFYNLDEAELRNKFDLKKDSRDWILKNAIQDVKNNHDKKFIAKCLYRGFDERFIYYTGNSKGYIAYSQRRIMDHFFEKENIGLIISRQGGQANPKNFDTASITNKMVDLNYYRRGGEAVCPLYLYHEDGTKTPNLDSTIWKKIDEVAGKTEPEDILDYIYAVLHSPSYREKYKEFLKIDFPRVPYPKDKKSFCKLVELGRELRSLHLLESEKVDQFITTFPVGGSNQVEKGYPKYKEGNVYINTEQYFGKVPEVAWNFYIGGYQPAQKWLKDRRERQLSLEDIQHYQKVIVALSETDRIMKEIDKVFKV